MNAKSIPPLKSLQIFSVAAKSESFSEAADKLCITQSAVSHQLKKLEAFTGCKLFYRSNNQMQLTDQGKQLAIGVQQGLTQISNALETVRGNTGSIIKLGVYSALALHKVMPAFGEFCKKHPQLDIQLRMLSWSEDIAELGLDIAITDHPVDDLSYSCTCLKQEEYYPVMAATLRTDNRNLSELVADPDTPLIDLPGGLGWQSWAELHQTSLPKRKIQVLSHAILLLKAAIAGQGIAFAGASLIESELKNGTLVTLSGTPLRFDNDGYFLSFHKKWEKDPAIVVIRNWIMSLLSVHQL